MDGKRPNLLLISIDSLRKDEAGFAGGTSGTTPNISAFSEQSMVYSNAITPSTWTLPVHTSIFTGLYPLEHGVIERDRTLGDHPTLAELLSANGYQTRAFYHNSWIDIGNINDGFESTDEKSESPSFPVQLSKKLIFKYGLDKYIMEFLEYIKRPSRDKQTLSNFVQSLAEIEEPFATFVHFNDAHYKHNPNWKSQTRFSNRGHLSLAWHRLYWQNAIWWHKSRYWAKESMPPEKVIETTKELYRACISEVDILVGEVLSHLNDVDLLDDTIVCLFADHGDSFGEDGIFGHQFSVDNSITNVPLLIRDPTGTIGQGKSNELVQLNDLYPTILGLCGIDAPDTNSIDIATQKRKYAYTQYELAENSHVDEGITESHTNDLPPRKQYKITTENNDLVYYPEINKWNGNNKLKPQLEQHLDLMDPIEHGHGEDIPQDVEQTLRNMGYLD